MWPKLLMQYLPQLIELLPHVRRVVPMADRYLQGRSAGDAALAGSLEGLRGELGQDRDGPAGGAGAGAVGASGDGAAPG